MASLFSLPTDSQILAALDNLPEDLPHTFERILSKLSNRDIAFQVFQWIAVAQRPLTLEETREAVAIEPFNYSLDTAKRVKSDKQLITSTANLTSVDEEQQTIHFVHASVKQYLFSEAAGRLPNNFEIKYDFANAEVGAACLTYLNLPALKGQVSKQKRYDIDSSEVTSAVVRASMPSGRTANWIALNILKKHSSSGTSVQRLLEEASAEIKATRQRDALAHFSFLSYAREFWLSHCTQLVILEDNRIRQLWQDIMLDAEKHDTLWTVPWTLEAYARTSPIVVEWAIIHRHRTLLYFLAEQGELDIESLCTNRDIIFRALSEANGAGMDVILASIEHQHLELYDAWYHIETRPFSHRMQDLMPTSGKWATSLRTIGRSALQQAVVQNHEEVVARILDRTKIFFSHSAVNDLVDYAMYDAAKRGRLSLFRKYLLKYLQSIPYLSHDSAEQESLGHSRHVGASCMHAAIRGGHVGIVQDLLKTYYFTTYYSAHILFGFINSAAIRGRRSILHILLDSNASRRTFYNSKSNFAIITNVPGCWHTMRKISQEDSYRSYCRWPWGPDASSSIASIIDKAPWPLATSLLETACVLESVRLAEFRNILTKSIRTDLLQSQQPILSGVEQEVLHQKKRFLMRKYLETLRKDVYGIDRSFVTHWLNTAALPSDALGQADLKSLRVLAVKAINRAGHRIAVE